MLRSPGHSPRQLTPSPSPASSTPRPASPTPSSASASASTLATTSSKRRRPEVLDEDSYVVAIERIIERDFFPDLPRLRDRLDWLQAVRSRDPLLLRDAQLKILDRRRRLQRNGPLPTPTPATSTALRSPSFLATPAVAPSTAGDPEEEDEDVSAALSLDDFFRRYTSEDNESFSRILEKVNHRRRERYAHLLEPGEVADKQLLEDAKRDRITDGYGTSGQPPSTLEGAKFTAKNLLMYHPADRGEAPLTDEELAVRLKGLTKEIDKSNTRLHGKALAEDGRPKEEEAAAILYALVAGSTPGGMAYNDPDKGKKYDLEDLRKTPNPFYIESGKKADNGYSFVKTPSPAPGVDESPFMTWGEIDGTPLRLDPDETPGGSERSHFKIPPPPVRDVKAHLLSRDAAKKIKARTHMFHKPPLPSPVRGGSASPRNLSPAAQKFVRNAIAKSTRTIDESLRASYRGSTPSAGTPKTRFSTDPGLGSRSPSARKGSTPPW
ncbi:splicing factor ESS-2 homolog [Triticum dicoccoides]|uniref:splicing factor ESS-2 homolog n=1 Tax=Triticum dicoccoides TaxID=85692 RepID=UPI000E7B7C5F|nr:splicing factor ESS-2 homolog [Triticum dicoccoides]